MANNSEYFLENLEKMGNLKESGKLMKSQGNVREFWKLFEKSENFVKVTII